MRDSDRTIVIENRYLTKITDQLVVLVSKEQGSKLVWMDKQDVDESDPFADDDSDRLVSFEVKKASEQEENVQLKDGFAVCKFHSDIEKRDLDLRDSSTRRSLLTTNLLVSYSMKVNYAHGSFLESAGKVS